MSLLVSVKKQKNPCKTKVFFVVSKKDFKTAVLRNRVKRVLREASKKAPFHESRCIYTIKAQKGIEKMSFAEVSDVLVHKVQKLNIQ